MNDNLFKTILFCIGEGSSAEELFFLLDYEKYWGFESFADEEIDQSIDYLLEHKVISESEDGYFKVIDQDFYKNIIGEWTKEQIESIKKRSKEQIKRWPPIPKIPDE